MSVSGDPDEYMGDDSDDLPLEGSSQFAMDLDKGAEWLHNLTNLGVEGQHCMWQILVHLSYFNLALYNIAILHY